MIKAAIFDLDGTLLDSMGFWENVAALYLRDQGIEADGDIGRILYPMSMLEGAAYIRGRYQLKISVEQIVDGINNSIANFYRYRAELKTGVRELLERLSAAGVKMTVATASDRQVIEPALSRLSLDKYFMRVFTCTEIGVGKTEPDIFLKAAEYMSVQPAETWVFEDAFYALKSAAFAGFKTVAVADQLNQADKENLMIYSDLYLNSFAYGWERLMNMNAGIKTVLSIAGSDSSGGAGIQADIKTITAHGAYAMTAITALTAQNTTGVVSVQDVTPLFLEQQLDAVFSDIYPDAVKIGMASSSELIEVISSRLKLFKPNHIVVDPVITATSGSALLRSGAVDSMINLLLPKATLITPNIPEAQIISGLTIADEADMIRASVAIYERYGCPVLCKGGHSISDADDLLYDGGEINWFRGVRIETSNTHGTGCTLSSAIATNLAHGKTLYEAIKLAKDYVSQALASMIDLGQGSGPLDHAWNIRREGRINE